MEEVLEFLGEGAGWIMGLGITLGVASAFSENGRPIAKRAVKGCFAAVDRARTLGAEMTEQLQDLYAEAKMEYETTRTSTVTNGPLISDPDATAPANGKTAGRRI